VVDARRLAPPAVGVVHVAKLTFALVVWTNVIEVGYARATVI